MPCGTPVLVHSCQPRLPSIHALVSLLQQSSQDLNSLKSIHAQAITHCVSTDEFLGSKLVKFYSDLGCLGDAHNVFDRILHRKTLSWNAMIGGYLRNQEYETALELYREMRCNGVAIDACTRTFALKACTKLGDVETGRDIIRNANPADENNPFFGSSTISFLVKFGTIAEAQAVFNHLCRKDVVCWNSMIGGYVQVCNFRMAFDMFFKMQAFGIKPTPVTIAALVHACIGMGSLRHGKLIHGYVHGLGISFHLLVVTSLIDMYGKLGDVDSASRAFHRMSTRNMVSWNAMLSGYIQNGFVSQAFVLFRELVLSGKGGF